MSALRKIRALRFEYAAMRGISQEQALHEAIVGALLIVGFPLLVGAALAALGAS